MSFEKEGMVTLLVGGLILMSVALILNDRLQKMNTKLTLIERMVADIWTMEDI